MSKEQEAGLRAEVSGSVSQARHLQCRLLLVEGRVWRPGRA